MDVLTAVLSAAVSASLVVLSEWIQRRFFVPYLQTHPMEPRQPPMLRMGLGLDETTFGPWDVLPAWRVLNREVPPDLVTRQRAARLAFLLLPVFVVVGPILFVAERSPFVYLGWFAGLVAGTAFRGWGSAITVSRHTYDEGLDRTSRIVLRLTVALPLLVIVRGIL